MEQGQLENKLKKDGVRKLTTSTRVGTYSIAERTSLLKKGVSNRSSADWKKAQFVIVNKDKDNSTPIDSCIAGWKSVAEKMQFLFIYEENEWRIYDYMGNLTSYEEMKEKAHLSSTKRLPKQVIFYGAPGTGKSHTIDSCTNENNRIRTTFHPDSDYSTFVGAYKPTMQPKKADNSCFDIDELCELLKDCYENTRNKILSFYIFYFKYAESLKKLIQKNY